MRPARAATKVPGLTFEVQEITPAMAAEWLRVDTELRAADQPAGDLSDLHQRRLMPNVVDRYAAQILADSWQLNGESIKFAPDGRLLDGQHRLQAVVYAQRSIWSVVARNVPPETFETIDTGKHRRIADVLSIVGQDRPNRLAPALNLLARYDWTTGKFASRTSAPVSNAQALATLREHPQLPESVVATERAAILVGWGIAAALHYIFAELSTRAEADLFFEQLGSGVNLSKRSSIYCLRERALAAKLNRAERLKRERLQDLVIKAWLKRGEVISHLKIAPGEELTLPRRRRAPSAA